MTAVESRLRDALFDGAAAARREPRPLRAHPAQHRRRPSASAGNVVGGWASIACLLGAIAAIVFATTERRQGEWLMDWWVLEIFWSPRC